jgi:hypothetical protein
MKKYFASLITLLPLTGLVVAAADIDGKWTRQQPANGGEAPVTETLTLRSSGSNLTGSIDLGRGGAVDISEGKITGGKVTFKVFRQPGDTGQIYTGTVSATELRLTVTSNYLISGGKGGPDGPPPPPPGGNATGKRIPQEQVWTKAK